MRPRSALVKSEVSRVASAVPAAHALESRRFVRQTDFRGGLWARLDEPWEAFHRRGRSRRPGPSWSAVCVDAWRGDLACPHCYGHLLRPVSVARYVGSDPYCDQYGTAPLTDPRNRRSQSADPRTAPTSHRPRADLSGHPHLTSGKQQHCPARGALSGRSPGRSVTFLGREVGGDHPGHVIDSKTN